MSNRNMPVISIGMIVYNGADCIREALDSVLAQEYTNFEFIISDDASTDDTQKICLEYAARDHRIHYYRNAEKLGMYKNFKQAFDYAIGEFFLWVAHDDIWHPLYLKELLELLLTNETAVIAGCKVIEFVPDHSEQWEVPLVQTTLGMSKIERLQTYIEKTPHAICHLIYGLFRRQILADSKALRLAGKINDPRIGFDHLIIFDCLTQGDVVTSEQPFFYGRIGGEAYQIESRTTLWQRINRLLKFSITLRCCFRWEHLVWREKFLVFKMCCINDWRRLLIFFSKVKRFHLLPALSSLQWIGHNMWHALRKHKVGAFKKGAQKVREHFRMNSMFNTILDLFSQWWSNF